MTADLDRIRALHAAITPGPWRTQPVENAMFSGLESHVHDRRGVHILLGASDGEAGQAKNNDAAFIAAAPSTVERLLGIVDRLEILARNLGRLAPGDQHYAGLIRAAITGGGE